MYKKERKVVSKSERLIEIGRRLLASTFPLVNACEVLFVFTFQLLNS